jgi:glycosyltransferase involved in cell wall biosynthesis
LLFLSRLHEKKGLDMLLEVWGQLRPAQWRLQIVGSGEPDYVNRLRQYCDTHQLPRVEFIPHVEGEEREAAFADAAVFVLPTFSENFGNVVVEALMRGVPVITTTGTPWSEIPARGCGWYIEPTATALKEVLAGVFDTPALALRQMGERGRAYATNNFSLPVVRDALLQMYRFAIAPGARHVS